MGTRLILLTGKAEAVSAGTNRLAGLIQEEGVVPKSPDAPPAIVEIRYTEETGYTITKYASIRRCGVIRFSNFTDGKVYIQFPARGVFGGDALVLEPAGSMGSSKKLLVASDAPIGEHTYSAFCQAGMEYAIGGSMPIIIINPKDDR